MKETNLMTFENPTLGTLRGFIDDNGEPWFLAGQVCRSLGIKNSADAVANVTRKMHIVSQYYRDKKGIDSTYTLTPITIRVRTGKGLQNATAISEGYLYELIFASKKQDAIVFRAWVTTDVLPALRKHGEYRMDGKLIRRSLTDTMKTETVDKSDSANGRRFAYRNFTSLINRPLGLPPKVDKGSVPDDVLEKIARREDIVRSMVADGKSYREIKAFLEECE